jgi:exopolysaccharide biosynthesis polyprenyl glycosylphosphotransferase
VGAGGSGQALVRVLSQANDRGYPNPFSGTGHDIVGFIDDNPQLLGEEFEGLPVLGDSSQLVELVRTLEIDEVVIAITNSNNIQLEMFEAILTCRERGLPIVTMPTIYERLTGRVAVEHASRNIEIAAGLPDSPFYRMYGITKRLVDIVGAIVGLCFLAILIPIIALANLIASSGPLFFKQTRVGHQGMLFEVIKFRSMVPDAEKGSGAVWASEDDIRITPIGRFLRTTHLDEIPQVINVLRGEMSFIGPRPERPDFVEQLSRSIPFYRVRLAVRPGITGWAQIHQDYSDSYVGAKDKLEYDLYYLKRAGPRIDTVILLRTVTKVFGLQGR